MKNLFLGLVLVLGLAACGSSPDCGTLPAPTAEQKAAAAQNVRGEAVEVEVELENEIGTAECVVQGNEWVDVTDADEAA